MFCQWPEWRDLIVWRPTFAYLTTSADTDKVVDPYYVIHIDHKSYEVCFVGHLCNDIDLLYINRPDIQMNILMDKFRLCLYKQYPVDSAQNLSDSSTHGYPVRRV